MYQNTKSATTAGLLGIFLGAFGAHNWYLGEKNKGIVHVCMMCGGVLVEILAGAILPNVMSFTMLIQMAWIFTILTAVAGLAMSASGIWGLVEGIIILSQGDAGLARKGYAVAQPMQMPMQNYGYQNGYNQPMNNGHGMPNNMNMNNMNGMNNMNNGMGNTGNMSNDMNSNMDNNQQNNNGGDNGQQ